MTAYRVRLLLDVTLDAEEPAHAEDVVKEIVLDAVEEQSVRAELSPLNPRLMGHKVRWCNAIKEEDCESGREVALALYGQPFGFTREDVKVIRAAIPWIHQRWDESVRPEMELLASLADRIEALLPPEEP